MPKQILLVDDSVTIQRVVELTFAHESDYKVIAAKSADEGLHKARELKPDIVLADAGMMGKTGYDLCASLRSDGGLASTPCLILTGNFAPYDEARGTKAGADGYVVKPFETQALIDKVADAISRKGARPAASAPATAPPIVATGVGRKDDSLEIQIEGGKTVPTPVPATRPVAPPPAPPAPPPAAKPPTAPPQARTMMGIPAPTVVPPAPPKPVAPPPPVAVAPPPPQPMPPPMTPPAAVAAPPKPALVPAVVPAAAAMPVSVPQMPRAPMIPGVPMPTSPAKMAEAPKAAPPPPRATLMGIPTVNPANLPPGAVALPPAMGKPAAPWAPPVPAAHAPTPIHPPASPPPPQPMPPPAASPAHAAVVSAVADRAVAEVSARGADYEAVAKLSREVIERIAWEVVPELAETIIREQLDRLVAERQK